MKHGQQETTALCRKRYHIEYNFRNFENEYLEKINFNYYPFI